MPKRYIESSIWADSWFENLDSSDKLLFFYLLTNDRTNMLGIYEVSMKKISFDTGLTTKAICKGFEGFAKASKAFYTDENYVVLKNFLKHQRFNANMKKSALAIYKDLPNSLKIKDLKLSNLTLEQGFESLCQGFGIFNLIEVEVEIE
ncbi:MAG: hypothetical protein HRT89_07610, partial [Lentisphaeria bacterium]|nr:hypothetical protein [Lentisphaeria bacterium]